MIDEPKGNAFSSGQRTAGWTVAPVVKKVITRAGPMLGVYPDESRDVDVSELPPLLWRNGDKEKCGCRRCPTPCRRAMPNRSSPALRATHERARQDGKAQG